MDVFSQADQLKRNRALIDAMMQQNMASQPQGNTGLGQALSKIATAYILAKRGDSLAEKDTANRAQYQSELSGELQKYLDTRNGLPGQTMTTDQAQNLMQNDVAPNLQEPTQGNPRQAVINAMASRFPELQAVGRAEFPQLGKQEMGEIKEVNGRLVRLLPGQAPQVIGDYSNPQVVEGRAMRFGPDGKPQVLYDARPKFGAVTQIGTGPNGEPIMGQLDADTGKASFAPKGTTVNVDTTGKIGQKFGEKQVEGLMPGGASFVAADSAAKNLAATQEALASLNGGGDTGAAADPIQTLRKFGERLGISNAATSPTDNLSAILKQRILAKTGGLGNQISDADRLFMTSASGDLSTDPIALRRLLALDAVTSMKQIERHNRIIDARLRSDPTGEAYPGMEDYKVFQELNAGSDPMFAQMLMNVMAGKPTIDTPPKGADRQLAPRQPAQPMTIPKPGERRPWGG